MWPLCGTRVVQRVRVLGHMTAGCHFGEPFGFGEGHLQQPITTVPIMTEDACMNSRECYDAAMKAMSPNATVIKLLELVQDDSG